MTPARFVPLLVALLAATPILLATGLADPAPTAPQLDVDDGARCGHDPAPDLGTEIPCPARIRPGARMSSPSGCTMNFVVTDGTEHYIGTAAHCVGFEGQSVSLSEIGRIGTVRMDGHGGDWAFVHIEAHVAHLIEPTMCRYGGPYADDGGAAVRAPQIGDPILHYGHGFVWGATEATRARGSAVVLPWGWTGHDFAFVGIISPGDSGSPVRFASGEAAGIAVSHLRVDPFGVIPSVAFAERFDRAVENFSAYLGRPVTVLEGARALDLPLAAPALPAAPSPRSFPGGAA